MAELASTDSKPVSEKDHPLSSATSQHQHQYDDDLPPTDSKPFSDREFPLSSATSQHQDKNDEPTEEYAQGFAFYAIFGAVVLCTFLVAIDNTIVSTAIPKITDDFRDLSQVAWYGSAYFMTFGGFQSMWGKLYHYFHLKLWILIAIGIFELGSLLCGVAPNSTTFIIGRALAGLGAAGVTAGTFTIVGFIAPPSKRPTLLGLTGAVYGIAAVLGPIVGGAYINGQNADSNSHVDATSSLAHAPLQIVFLGAGCFYINLPIGGLSLVLITLFFRTPEAAKPAQVPFKEKLLQLDPVGVVLIVGFITSLILAFQYGGQTKPWNSSTVIGLFVGSGVMLLGLVAWEIFQKERAAIVPRLITKRHMYVGSVFMFFFAGSYFIILYYLPIYFQTVKGTSPIGSGVRMLAMIIPLTITATIQGPALTKIRIAPIFWVIGGALCSIACGLFYTMNQQTGTGDWIGYQIVAGVGVAWGFQTAISVAQVHAPPEDMSQVSAIIFFNMAIGGAVLLSAADSGFNNQIIRILAKTAPNIDPKMVLGTGASEIREVFSPAQVPLVVQAYIDGLQVVWAFAAGTLGVSAIIGLFGSWKRMNVEGIKTAGAAAA